MPWEHCGQSVGDDIKTCPECGSKKDSWTMRFDTERVFQLGSKDDAQADALTSASDEGLPFCEECENAAEEQEAEAAGD